MSTSHMSRVVISQGKGLQNEWPQQIFLPSPKTGSQQAYFYDGKSIQEVNSFQPQYSSWLVDNHIVSDGALYLLSAVDPLLLALPFLERARNKSKDELFSSHGGVSEAAASALSSASTNTLDLICDLRGVNDESFYRLNDVKVRAWLKCKVQQLVTALGSEGSQYSGMDLTGLQRYAVGLLGEYLSAHQLEDLTRCYHFPAQEWIQPSIGQPDVTVTVSTQGGKKKPRVDPKLLARQRALEAREEKKQQQLKRETAGMKKMCAFFAPKAHVSST